MLLLASALKLIAETALMAFAGRWLLGLLAGPGRRGNVFHQLLVVLTEPFVGVVRSLAPRALPPRWQHGLAFLALAALWLSALAWKVAACRAQACLAGMSP